MYCNSLVPCVYHKALSNFVNERLIANMNLERACTLEELKQQERKLSYAVMSLRLEGISEA